MSLGIKRSSKARKNPWSAKFRNPKRAPAKMALGCEMISQPHTPLCEKFCSCKTPPWHTSAISQPFTLISQLQNGLRKWPSAAKSTICCKIAHLLCQRGAKPEQPSVCPPSELKPHAPPATFSEIAMAKTRGAKSSSPSSA
ncbi:hypothetical protein CK203_115923 [Vitis vinifera]|uniref:Uncharacterized protein n=1 Tax=Vitis vinifera TaxID=29760 RepID=A0A438CBW2_VITVI|nr:hypothetical protein CK203_115923 [Vitis vinifera]